MHTTRAIGDSECNEGRGLLFDFDTTVDGVACECAPSRDSSVDLLFSRSCAV